MASDEERDYDEQYGFDDFIDRKEDDMDNIHKQFKQSKEKIAISIGTKIIEKNEKKKENDDVLIMNEEDVMIRNAKLKLKALKENEMKIEMEKKQKVKEELMEDNDECGNDQNINQIDEALLIQNEVNGNKDVGVFKKKKKKKKKRQIG